MRTRRTASGGARTPHAPRVHCGSCAPAASAQRALSTRSDAPAPCRDWPPQRRPISFGALLRAWRTAPGSARNPHALRVHCGSCALAVTDRQALSTRSDDSAHSVQRPSSRRPFSFGALLCAGWMAPGSARTPHALDLHCGSCAPAATAQRALSTRSDAPAPCRDRPPQRRPISFGARLCAGWTAPGGARNAHALDVHCGSCALAVTDRQALSTRSDDSAVCKDRPPRRRPISLPANRG